MRWFGWFRSDPKKEMRKAAEAYKKMQDRNIDVYNGMGTDNGKSAGFFEAYGSVIEAYIDKFKDAEEDDAEIKKLKTVYLTLHPKKAQAVQAQNSGPQENAALGNSEQTAPSSAAASTPVSSAEAPKNEDKENSQRNADTPSAPSAQEVQKAQSAQSSQTSDNAARENAKQSAKDGGGSVGDKVREHIARTELHHALGDKENEELSQGIDSAAMAGMQKISQWMLRNCVKSGIFRSAKTSDERISYIHTFALKQPARVKLYAYYMIENGLRKETDPEKIKENISASQLGYVPDLEKFKSQMIATKFKFWKRFTGSEILWTKLEEGFRAARESKEDIKPFGDMSILGSSGSAPSGPASNSTNQPAQTAQNASAPTQTPSAASASQSTNTASGPAADQARDSSAPAPVQDRRNKYEEFRNRAKDIVDKKNKLLKADSKEKKTIEEEIRKAVKELIGIIKQLKTADQAVSEALTSSGMGVVNEAQDKVEKYTFYGGLGGQAAGGGGSGVRAAGDNDFITWGLDKNTEEGLNKLEQMQEAGNIISVVGASISLISLVVRTVDYINQRGQMTAGAKVAAGMDVLASGGSIAKGMTMGIMGLAGAADAATAVGGYIGIGAGTAGMIVGGVNFYNAYKQKHRAKEMENTFARRVNLSQTPGETQKKPGEESEELQDSRKALNTAKLTKRLADGREDLAIGRMTTGALDIIAGALAVSGVASGFGALFAGVSAAVNLGLYLWKLSKKKKIVYETIDDFIDTGRIYDDVVGEDKPRIDKDREGQIKRQIRIQAASELGYSSRETLFNGITVKYAENIFKNVFYKKGTKTEAKNEKESDPDYIKLLKTLQLKPDYGSKKPKVNTIAYKLQNL